MVQLLPVIVGASVVVIGLGAMTGFLIWKLNHKNTNSTIVEGSTAEPEPEEQPNNKPKPEPDSAPVCYCSNMAQIELSELNQSKTISSPGYPEGKCSNLNCRWIVSVPDSFLIKLEWQDFQTVQDSDYVYIYGGETIDAPLLATCSGSECTDIHSSENKLHIQFTTDTADSKGFSATVKVIQ